MFKRNDSQDIIHTYMVDDINVTINSLYLYIPNLIPSVETQLFFTEPTQKNYKIYFDEWYTERRLKSDLLVQHDIGSTQQVNSPKYLFGAHKTQPRTTTPDKKKRTNFALFDNLGLQKLHIERDSIRYPRDSVLMNYEKKRLYSTV